jgi:hypothetical protein
MDWKHMNFQYAFTKLSGENSITCVSTSHKWMNSKTFNVIKWYRPQFTTVWTKAMDEWQYKIFPFRPFFLVNLKMENCGVT